MDTLMAQTFQDFEVHVVVDRDGRGQSWARNRGLDVARGEYILFSDSDIEWCPDALERLLATLEAQPDDRHVGYAYGPYQFLDEHGPVGDLVGAQPWDWADLQRNNYISTMCLVRASCRPTFDEHLRRLEDWDLWLRLGSMGICGAWEPNLIFRTRIRTGVSFNNPLTHEQAEAQVRAKHRTWLLSLLA
jgi:glycosyltransferase involved in cell wall biosynthesis